MIINHNISALNAHRQLGANQSATQSSLEKLSSGLGINKAGDDAAGLAISEKMRGQINGLEMASKNAQDGISLIQTAEGALNETHAILQRMRELAVQSSNDTNTDSDRAELQKEVDQLAAALDDISSNTEFNEKKLLDGSLGETGAVGTATDATSLTFHVGANSSQNLTLNINKMDSDSLAVAAGDLSSTDVGDFAVTNTNGEAVSVTIADPGANDAAFGVAVDGTTGAVTINLATDASGTITTTKDEVLAALNNQDGLSATLADTATGTDAAVAVTATDVDVSTFTAAAEGGGIDISSQTSADAAITTIQSAIDNVSAERSKLGAVQNRLDHTINNLGTSAENLTAAESRIRDVDMAKEMMEFTKNNILSQAAQSMLAQANQQPQGVLQLLQ